MDESPSLDELKDLGAGRPAPTEVIFLYRRAFAEYRVRALWNWCAIEHPTITQALSVADSLRTEGNLNARRLAVEIEQACRAAL